MKVITPVVCGGWVSCSSRQLQRYSAVIVSAGEDRVTQHGCSARTRRRPFAPDTFKGTNCLPFSLSSKVRGTSTTTKSASSSSPLSTPSSL